MKLAKKNPLNHLDATKAPAEGSPNAEDWKVNDWNAFAIITMMIDPQYQSMVRDLPSAAKVWEVLKDLFVHRNVLNRIELRRRLHDFKMAKRWIT